MKPSEDQISKIRNDFAAMATKDDLLSLLNFVKSLVYGDEVKPFLLKQITWYANPSLSKNRYKEFKIRKKSGGERTINAPVAGLKAIQKTLAFILQCIFEAHPAATGFSRGKSIVDNAKIHVGANYVYNIDLKDFFPSIDQARVWKCLQLRPFNLTSGKQLDFKVDIPEFIGINQSSEIKKSLKAPLANIIASLCCSEMEVERISENGEWGVVKRNVLPQGAPTSPVLTNIICQRLDYLLSAVAKRFHIRYSRYADDITFSSKHNVFQQESDFVIELHRIISNQGFHIKEQKTRLQKEGYRQEVTGLVVNKSVNVQKRYIKTLRMWLYLWERYGYDKAYTLFLKDYRTDKGDNKKGKPDIENVIGGKLEFLRMVRGSNDPAYIQLNKRFQELIDKIKESQISKEDIHEVANVNSSILQDETEKRQAHLSKTLEIFSFDGIQYAMKYYKPKGL